MLTQQIQKTTRKSVRHQNPWVHSGTFWVGSKKTFIFTNQWRCHILATVCRWMAMRRLTKAVSMVETTKFPPFSKFMVKKKTSHTIQCWKEPRRCRTQHPCPSATKRHGSLPSGQRALQDPEGTGRQFGAEWCKGIRRYIWYEHFLLLLYEWAYRVTFICLVTKSRRCCQELREQQVDRKQRSKRIAIILFFQ